MSAGLWSYHLKHRVKSIVAKKSDVGDRPAFARWDEPAPQPVQEAVAASRNIPDKAELYGYLGRAACARVLDLCYWRDCDAFPRLIGFDLDAVLPRRSWSDMRHFLHATIPALGWEMLMSVYRGPVWICLLARRDARIGEDDDFLEADLHSDFTVNGLPFADIAELLGRTRLSDGVRWLDDVDAAVCAYLQAAIANGQVKARYGEAFERARLTAPNRVEFLCAGAVGLSSGRILSTIRTDAGSSYLRRRLLWVALARRPLRTAAVILHKFADAAAMYWNPPGQLWTFSGPDGAGKTTVMNLLQPLVGRRIAVAVDRLHSRPYIIPRLAILLPRSRREEILTVRRYEQRVGLLKSVTRLIFLIADLQLGYWLKVRPMLARGYLVIFDRYYQDYVVDPWLRGISLPPAILKLCAHLVPRGHRHVYLMASAEVLEMRKNELSHEDAARQIAAYRRLASADPRALVIDGSQRPAAEIAKTIAAHLLDDVRMRASPHYRQ